MPKNRSSTRYSSGVHPSVDAFHQGPDRREVGHARDVGRVWVDGDALAHVVVELLELIEVGRKQPHPFGALLGKPVELWEICKRLSDLLVQPADGF